MRSPGFQERVRRTQEAIQYDADGSVFLRSPLRERSVPKPSTYSGALAVVMLSVACRYGPVQHVHHLGSTSYTKPLIRLSLSTSSPPPNITALGLGRCWFRFPMTGNSPLHYALAYGWQDRLALAGMGCFQIYIQAPGKHFTTKSCFLPASGVF